MKNIPLLSSYDSINCLFGCHQCGNIDFEKHQPKTRENLLSY